MCGGIFATVLPVGLLLVTVVFVYLLNQSNAEDPKFGFLESLLRAANEEVTDAGQEPSSEPRPVLQHLT